MWTLMTNLAAQEGSGGDENASSALSVATQIEEFAGLAVGVLVPFWEGMARHHHAEDILTVFGAGTGI